ncbi:MAG: hypothetical protein IJS73_06905 [Paludibacteraceae bacterium]|nr:hypothetical protein [Paludibacteraceae bacterium]
MKKICLLALLCCAMFVQAQRYEVGQMIPQGTWNALVVYVDESGEHGLLMSPTAMREGTSVLKDAAKNAGMSVEDFIATMPLPVMARGEKDSKISKKMKEMMSQNLNGTNGVENCKNIADYCESNGLSMEAYFPEVVWAASLGEGWFIPGTDELELYAGVIAKGVGKGKDKKLSGLIKFDVKRDSLNKKVKENFQNGEAGGIAYFPSSICSSTFGCNKSFEKANKKKIVKVNGGSGGGLLGIATMIANNVNYPYYGLTLYKANNFTHYYMFNKKGVDYQPYTNAFKWF